MRGDYIIYINQSKLIKKIIMHNLKSLMARGAEFLGCPHAILGGAMSWVSERNLVSALSNAGAFGVIAASSMPSASPACEM